MSEELWCQKVDREAAEKVAELLTKPLPERGDMQDIEEFDPWDIFPIYGSYDSAFDERLFGITCGFLHNTCYPDFGLSCGYGDCHEDAGTSLGDDLFVLPP